MSKMICFDRTPTVSCLHRFQDFFCHCNEEFTNQLEEMMGRFVQIVNARLEEKNPLTTHSHRYRLDDLKTKTTVASKGEKLPPILKHDESGDNTSPVEIKHNAEEKAQKEAQEKARLEPGARGA